jgi:hypothetical protein
MTINYLQRRYTYQNIHAATRKVLDASKTALDTLSLPDRAHHFQVYSDAVASADDIAINRTPLVISLK